MVVVGGSRFSDQMFGVSSRLSILLNGPISHIHHRPSTLLCVTHRHSLSCPLSPLSTVPRHLLLPYRANSLFPIKSSQQFYTQSTLQEKNHVPADAYLVSPSHPWPEWSLLLESISMSGAFDLNRNIKEEFVPNESLSMEFLDAACSCLRFAHDRPEILGCLPKDDIQVLIDEGTPFLFKSSLETERKMRSFLQGDESNEATTVDLMKYILSYASNPIIYPERNIREATESSARNLLREMAKFNSSGAALSLPTVEKFNEIGPTMKRGEWLCSKCNFFNHGRNVVCLKCECSRSGEPNGQMKTSGQDAKKVPNGAKSGYAPFVPLPADMFAKKPDEEKKPASNIKSQIKDTVEEEKSEKWFSKVAELHDATDLPSVISDEDFPEIMPLRKGENRFVVSKKKDRSLTSPKYKQESMEKGSGTNFVPFVPFPPDYFSKKDDSKEVTENTIPTDEAPDTNLVREPLRNQENEEVRNGWNGKSLEGSAVKETDPLDMSEEAKAERWFRRVAQIKDISELSQIPDEDFPEIMPMRKGVNRFVVSKRKTPLERRLTNPPPRLHKDNNGRGRAGLNWMQHPTNHVFGE
ncbi:unnamed protein product [Lactuca saligna]|uniref:RanBP2-type domain-containing protein n=1 Tax=Lactuca saligna TaxID=75948 RepID=A0AA36E578_LACSI|nr:unnamed protein product [Lactuca saligna]